MNRKFKWIGLAAAVLTLSLLVTGTAFAEGEEPTAPNEPAAVEGTAAPPESPAPIGEQAPAEEPAPEEPAPVEAAAPDDEAATEEPILAEEPAPAEDTIPAEGVTPEEDLPAEPLPLEDPLEETVPAEPAITLVDAAGEVLDAASQESAELLVSGDPYWFVGGMPYSSVSNAALCYPGTVLGVSCWVSTTPIQNAINLIAATPSLAPDFGTLHVEYGVYPDMVVIDGVNQISALEGHASGLGIYPTFSKLTISNMLFGFALNGFTISGGVFISASDGDFLVEDVAAPLTFTDIGDNFTSSIYVDNHKGNVTLTRVTASGNTGGTTAHGAIIENLRGGNVAVTESDFNDNEGKGLYVDSLGTVTLTRVNANRNDYLAGIYVDTNGAITLNTVSTNSNGGAGAAGIQAYSWLGAVTFTNVLASGNENEGITVEGKGAITLRSLVASDNGAGGVYAYTKGGAVLMENVVANDNIQNGVEIGAYPNIAAAVTLRNMTAHGNGDSGNGGHGIFVNTLGAVTVTNSFTNNNDGNGLYVITRGAALLTTIRASWNGYNGLMVEGAYLFGGDPLDPMRETGYASPASVTLTSPADPNFANSFDNNGDHGVYIISEKPVTIRNFSSNNNHGYGICVDKPAYWILNTLTKVWSLGSKNLGATLITTTIPAWRNAADRNMFGVAVYSAGNVTINALDTNENSHHSVDVQTLGSITLSNVSDWRNGESNTVYLDNMGAAGFMPVTVTNLEVRETQGDWGAALAVHSKGAITITGLWLEDNNCQGAALANAMDGRGNVTITNAWIQNNNGMGIRVFSNGVVAFTKVKVNGNFWGGAYIDNIAPYPLAPAVTLTDCEFSGSNGPGLEVYSKGLITLKGVDVQGNGIGFGVMDIGQTVYEFNHPDWWGEDEWDFYYGTDTTLTITLRGFGFEPVVMLVDMDYNPIAADETYDEDGVFTSVFYNTTLPLYEPYKVVVWYDPMVSDGVGPYSLSINDSTESNQYFPAPGARLDNTAGTTAGVTVLPTASYQLNQFSNNDGGFGLGIFSNGAVSLTNLNAGDNVWGDGIHVEALGAVTVQSTVASQPVWASQNGGSGIFINTRGLITLANIQANDNGGSGAELDNALCEPDGMGGWINCTGTGGVTLRAFSGRHNEFKNNGMFGLWVNSRGALLLTNINAENNALDGAMLRNIRGLPMPAAPITVNTLGAVYNEFHNNGWDMSNYPSGDPYYGQKWNGLSVSSGGVITILNVNATGNDGGIVAMNSYAATAKGVTITNAYTGNNRWMGIYVESTGAITLTNGYAWNNGSGNYWDGGVTLDNSYAPAALPVTLTDWDIQDNQGNGLQVWSKGLITLKGVTVRGSCIRNGWMEVGQTVYENNQPDWGEDTWEFYYEGLTTDPLVITMRGYGLGYPVVVLVDSSWFEITPDDTGFSHNVWTSTFNYGTLAPDSYYRILVRWDELESDGWGSYSLSVNDVDETNQWFPADGARLDNTTGTTAGVTILPTAKHPFNEFSDNNSHGLSIFTNGPVAMTNLNAGRNIFSAGVVVEAGGAVSLVSTVADSPVWLCENGWNGIVVRTRGAITLKNIQANDNGGSGADLDNALCADYDDVTGTWYNCTGTGAITLGAISGRYNEFKGNGRFGLWAVSRGAITISNVQANSNGWDGAFLWNDGRGTAAAITVNSVGAVRSEFNDNARNTEGAVWFPDDIPLELNWMEPSDYYWSRFNGLTIMSGGAITILNSDVSDNQNGIGGGIVALNDQSLIQAPVLISNTNAQGNFWNGLYVGSKGAITLTTVDVRDNGEGGGIELHNAYCYYNNVLLKWVCPAPGAVTMTNITSENNGNTGLNVWSLGVVRLTTAYISGNSSGIHIENGCIWDDDTSAWVCPTFTNSITLMGVNANNNYGTGVEAFSRGLIALTTVFANNNWNDGIVLNNKDFYYPYNTTLGITLSNVHSNNNNGSGISARTNGTLGMANIRASGNHIWDGNISEGETVQDFANEYQGSDEWWFEATAGSDYELILTVNDWGNQNRMAFDPWMELYYFDINNWEKVQKDISTLLTCTYNDSCYFTFDPADFGYSDTNWFFVRLGSDFGDTSGLGDGFYRLSLNDPDPYDEPDVWRWANGLGFEAGGNVTLTGINTFQNNSLAGISGETPGNITLTNVGARDNGAEGIYVANDGGTGNVLITGTNVASGNGWEGLRITTNGTVSVSNLDASYNSHRSDWDLRSIFIEAFGVGKAVNLTNIDAQHNKGDGIKLDVYGITTFNAVRSWLNGDWGIGSGSGVWMNSHGYAINLLNYCWFIGNADSGFTYWDNSGTLIPNVTNSVFWGNGGDDLGGF